MNECGCSEEAAAAWIIIPLIAGVAIILALTLGHQEPFSKSARDQRESSYYDGYANKEDVAVIDTTAHQLNTIMLHTNTSAITNNATIASNTTWNGTAVDAVSDELAERSVDIKKIVALHNLD